MRKCKTCCADKPSSEYSPNGKICRSCHHKRKWLKRTYNISIEEFESIKRNQENMCAICSKNLILGRETHVDHCHATGKIRGLLCRSCNLAIGLLEDSVKSLSNAIDYLNKNK